MPFGNSNPRHGRTTGRRTFTVVTLIAALRLTAAAQLPLEPLKDSGQSVTAAYEGWFRNPDGTFTLLIGYLNRNQKQALDIPVGPNNRLEPGGPDHGQPTHLPCLRQREIEGARIALPGVLSSLICQIKLG